MLTKDSYTVVSEGTIHGAYQKRGAKVDMTADQAKYYLMEGRIERAEARKRAEAKADAKTEPKAKPVETKTETKAAD